VTELRSSEFHKKSSTLSFYPEFTFSLGHFAVIWSDDIFLSKKLMSKQVNYSQVVFNYGQRNKCHYTWMSFELLIPKCILCCRYVKIPIINN
jgi:hypothetical protein